MCGIVGIISEHNTKFIDNATQAIAHRGPDDSDVYKYKNLGLGHRRLSIIDLSINGHQPMFSDDGGYVLIFNGEIYNHLEVRERLTKKIFKSHSDTETLLYAFIEKGPDIFKELNGIFALTIFDIKENKLYIARDHYGIKPLYYYSNNDQFCFGSEIKSFLQIPDFDKSLNYDALASYHQYLYNPGSETPFKYVKKLEAGHWMKVDLHDVSFSINRYYSFNFNKPLFESNEEELKLNLEQRLTEAVNSQLLADVPIGYFLSGGLDSSLIVAMSRKINGKKLDCYTINTDIDQKSRDGFANDIYYAKKVAKHLDVNLQVVEANIDILQDFDKMIWHLDEPLADPAPLSVYNICCLAKQNNLKVLMSGAGGDDIFSGYRRHQALNYEWIFGMIPQSLGSPIIKLLQVVPQSNANVRRLIKVFRDINKNKHQRIAGYYEWMNFTTINSLFNHDLRVKQNTNLIDTLNYLSNNIPDLNKMLGLELKYFLTDHNLCYTDKMSMAAGIEVRVPYLDINLVEFSTQIPIALKMKGNETKYILKKVAEKYLPQDVIYRPKTGFGGPVRKWIIEDLNEMVNDVLSEKKINERGIYDYKEIKQLIELNRIGKIDASYTILSLLATESWMKQFVD